MREYIAEFIGTFILIFFGCGSMILVQTHGFDSSWVPAIWGISVAAAIYCLGHISGAHLNPAVSISFWAIKKISTKKLLGYSIGQLCGGLLASLLHLYIFGSDHDFGSAHLNIDPMGGFILEFLMGYLLMLVITSVATDSRAVGELAGISIGSIVFLCAAVLGPLTRASINPVRYFAPALLNGELNHFWLYIMAPILGAILGAITYQWLKCSKKEEEEGCC